uniref:Transmembrane protein 107 n=1 Tax=Ciona intestinalis TaxID=7719 RepID=F6XYQ4_CIOIN|nr:transmembrane protein 107-like isoform X1 [Ciona intestinalis]|eukprot:XP_002130259.1 transmembrane protein 107-like isoform X1 [Ciona intestinalis]
MRVAQSLVPARFLVLIAHLVIVITMFWSLDINLPACLPASFTTAQYNEKQTLLIVLLSITLGMFLIELGGFVSGFSMFNQSQSLLSIAAHAGACVSLSFYLFDAWDCNLYGYIFGFCSVLPAITELGIIASVLCFKKGF